MTEKERKLRTERAKLVADCRKVLDAAEAESRGLTADEDIKIKQMEADIKRLGAEAVREANLASIEEEMSSSMNDELPADIDTRTAPKKGEEHRDVMKKVLSTLYSTRSRDAAIDVVGRDKFNAMQMDIFFRAIQGRAGCISDAEVRALQLDADVSGGYLVAPEQLVAGLIQALDAELFVRKLATKYTIKTAKSLGAVSLDTDPADASWTGEISTASEDSSMAFGKRELTPHPLAKLIKVSRDLLRASGGAAERVVRERILYKLAYPMESAYLTGSGSGCPLGVMTASDYGISTSYDVSTGNTTTSITTDGLISAKMKLKPGYRNRPSTAWAFHTDAITQIMKLKDGEGRYLWQPSIVEGNPDRILNVKFIESTLMSNTFTAGLYVGIIGDWSYYWIVDSLDMEIQPLYELYATSNQVGFISRAKGDGMPVLGEAFARVKLADS